MKLGLYQKGILLAICFFITACSVQPKPVSPIKMYERSQRALTLLNTIQPPTKRLDFYQALALGVKYNLDYRIKLANNALQCGQLKLAAMAMLPALNASGSLYTRNNDLATFSTTSTGQTTDIVTSTPRTLRSSRVAFSWNMLDLGLSYVRARQQSERYLIAEEEARKQLQQLMQDITTAYWDAYSAQTMMLQAVAFRRELSHSKNLLDAAMRDRLVPKDNLLSYQQALLEGDRNILQLQHKKEKALSDLRHLLSLPLDKTLVLQRPPNEFIPVQDLRHLNFYKLDAITLSNRPELRGQNYQRRIAKFGVKIAIIQALPGLTANYGWNYNSNEFLINNQWMDKSLDVAWNLLNLASLPVAIDSAEAQVEYEQLKAMALTVTVLTETRYAFSHYQNVMDEYRVARAQYRNASAMYRLMHDRRIAALASDQQVMLAKIRKIAAKMDQDLLLSDLSTAFGELYLSTGYDLLSVNPNLPLPLLTKIIREHFQNRRPANFKQFVDVTYAELFRQKPTRTC